MRAMRLVSQALAECPQQISLTIARDGEQALAILSQPDFKASLIILDLNIPKLSGHIVLQRYDARKTPIVVFSSYWNDVDLDRAFALGVREYVQKPMDLDGFKQAVCRMVQKWAFPITDLGVGETAQVAG